MLVVVVAVAVAIAVFLCCRCYFYHGTIGLSQYSLLFPPRFDVDLLVGLHQNICRGRATETYGSAVAAEYFRAADVAMEKDFGAFAR